MERNRAPPSASRFFSRNSSNNPSSPTRRTSLPALRSPSYRIPKSSPIFWNSCAGAGGRRPVGDDCSVRAQFETQGHDQRLRREFEAAGVRRTDLLAAAAFGAGEEVENLAPGEHLDRPWRAPPVRDGGARQSAGRFKVAKEDGRQRRHDVGV